METKKRSSIARYLLMFLVLVVIVLVAGVLYAKQWYSQGISAAGSGDGSIVTVSIREGTSSDEIGKMLLDQGLIRSELMWKIYVRLNNPEFLAEEYDIPNNLSLEAIASVLQQPSANVDVWVTIQEGVTNKKVVEIMESAEADFVGGNFSAAEFATIISSPDAVTFPADVQEFLDTYKPEGKSLEGFLYPETYAFEDDATAQAVVETLLKQFMSEVSEYDLDAHESLSFYEVLTLASIVERESFGESDRALVASVFTNRLDDGIALQSDATVNYATGKSNPRPTFADLKIESPYNTYKYAGLTPTPIGNPRIESILVSLEPEASEFYYFIHDESGKAHFGKTLSDHNRNVCKYLDKTC